jgi:hypothetical protein
VVGISEGLVIPPLIIFKGVRGNGLGQDVEGVLNLHLTTLTLNPPFWADF